jgi:hypothetical protein
MALGKVCANEERIPEKIDFKVMGLPFRSVFGGPWWHSLGHPSSDFFFLRGT